MGTKQLLTNPWTCAHNTFACGDTVSSLWFDFIPTDSVVFDFLISIRII